MSDKGEKRLITANLPLVIVLLYFIYLGPHNIFVMEHHILRIQKAYIVCCLTDTIDSQNGCT